MSTTVSEKSQGTLLPQCEVNLLDQQFWRWGCDAKYKTGNLLVQYGFLRVPPPDPDASSSSAYYLDVGPHARIVLRSFAVFFGDDSLGGTILKRFDKQPYLTTESKLEKPPHLETDLPPLQISHTENDQWRELAAHLFCQIANYEAWIMREMGRNYTQETLTSRGKRPNVEADQTVKAWLQLAERYAQTGKKLATPL